MQLLHKLQEDMKAAMKRKDTTTLDVLRMTISSIKNKSIELGKELDDADVLSVVKSDVKKLRDALQSFVDNAREDLAEKAREELKVLEAYLPEQMTDGDLEQYVRTKAQELGVTAKTEFNKIMGPLSKELKDRADGSRIKAMLDKILS